MPNLNDKVAIVTGATSGLGRCIAMKLGFEGAKVVLTGRNQAAGEDVLGRIRESGGTAIFVQADLQDAEQARVLVQQALAQFGKVDVLVASAGAAPAAQGLFSKVEPQAVADQVARTILIKLNPAHAVVPHMIERNRGAILFLTSEGGRIPTPGQTATSFHSAGLIMASKVMAKELSRSKIRVNTLAVTLVEGTPVHDRFERGEMPEIRLKVFRKIQQQAPLGLAKAQDIAEVAAFLVSDSAAYITGATLSATGGATFP